MEGVGGGGGGIHLMEPISESCVHPTYPHLYIPVGVGVSGWGCCGGCFLTFLLSEITLFIYFSLLNVKYFPFSHFGIIYYFIFIIL